MTSPMWAQNDEELMNAIRAAVSEYGGGEDQGPRRGSVLDAAADPDTPPVDETLAARMRRAAKAAYTWRTIDQELERLTMNSDSDFQLAAAVRGPDPQPFRVVAFQGPDINLELEIGDDSVVGQVYPVQPGIITLMTAGGTRIESHTDEVGCFRFDRPADGPFRLRCDCAEPGLITEWISLI